MHERALRIAYDDYVSDSSFSNKGSVTIHQRNSHYSSKNQSLFIKESVTIHQRISHYSSKNQSLFIKESVTIHQRISHYSSKKHSGISFRNLYDPKGHKSQIYEGNIFYEKAQLSYEKTTP